MALERWRQMLLEPPGAADRAHHDLSRHALASGLVALVGLAALVRSVSLTADPPWHAPVGVVWHDEGAWTHNARNRALFGAWILDEWNPVFVAPVFTALEFASFSMFGVGLWQARLVSVVAGASAVALVGLGTARVASRAAGLAAAALLATNYISVMFDRAALMESTMTAWLVVAWYAYARGAGAPRWGLVAGAAAVAAYFTKASAVFFVAALGLDAAMVLAGVAAWGGSGVPSAALPDGVGGRAAHATSPRTPVERRLAWFTLTGLGVAGFTGLAAFVAPSWDQYWFYNWQVSVTRKPSYTLAALLDRASWFPIVHDVFTRMWIATALAGGALIGLLLRWRTSPPAERLLLWWVGLGVVELVLHDVGNERRFVFLVPALLVLAALALGRDRRLVPVEVAGLSRRAALIAAPALLFLLYVLVGALVRLAVIYEIRPGVRVSAALAATLGAAIYTTWPRVPAWVGRERWSARASAMLIGLAMAGNLVLFGQWWTGRTHKNVEASRTIGRRLPPGTVVHGKLANGLALENRIRPLFVGRGFGNYDDRLTRHDVRYLLTYTAPRIGYEGPVIRDVLEAYPEWRIIESFDVAETAGGHDRAALIDKGPPRVPRM